MLKEIEGDKPPAENKEEEESKDKKAAPKRKPKKKEDAAEIELVTIQPKEEEKIANDMNKAVQNDVALALQDAGRTFEVTAPVKGEEKKPEPLPIQSFK